MRLERALAQMEAEVAEFGQGSVRQPREGTTEWYVVRAKSLGLSFLRQASKRKLEGNPRAVDLLFKHNSVEIKNDETLGPSS